MSSALQFLESDDVSFRSYVASEISKLAAQFDASILETTLTSADFQNNRTNILAQLTAPSLFGEIKVTKFTNPSSTDLLTLVKYFESHADTAEGNHLYIAIAPGKQSSGAWRSKATALSFATYRRLADAKEQFSKNVKSLALSEEAQNRLDINPELYDSAYAFDRYLQTLSAPNQKALLKEYLEALGADAAGTDTTLGQALYGASRAMFKSSTRETSELHAHILDADKAVRRGQVTEQQALERLKALTARKSIT